MMRRRLLSAFAAAIAALAFTSPSWADFNGPPVGVLPCPNCAVTNGANTFTGTQTAPSFNATGTGGITNAGPLVTGGPANSAGGETGTIITNISPYNYPSANERSRYYYSPFTVTGSQSAIEEMDFYFDELSPLSYSNGAYIGAVGTITATVSGGVVQSPLTIATPGANQPNNTYNLVFSGNCGAAGTATISGGQITSTNLTNGGTGCPATVSVQIAEATVSGENNEVHPYGEIDAGLNFSGLFDPDESSFENFGIMSGTHNAFNGLYANQATGITTGQAMGLHLGVINQNTAPGSIAQYTGIYMQPFSGSGTPPTNYYFLDNADPNAGSNILGGVVLGSLNPSAGKGTLDIYGPDVSGSTYPLFIRGNNSGTLTNILSIADNGQAALYGGFLTVGSAGSVWGRIGLTNPVGGVLYIAPPTTGTLSGTVSFPNATTTLAGLGVPQTFTQEQTFSAGALLTPVATASLPTCNSGANGLLAAVTDATSPTYNGTLTGGGAVSVPVYCNGTNWTTH